MSSRERLSLPIIPSGENYRAWQIQPLETEQRLDFRALAENIVGYASLAASTHNVQPWKFGINLKRRTITLRVDKDKILPASDATRRESFVSVGCALTNLEVAASYYRLEPQVVYLPQPDDQFLAAEVTLSEGGEPRDLELFKAITTRAVNRSEYDPERMIPDNVLTEMKNCIDVSELELHVITDMPTRLFIAEIQKQAALIVLNTDMFREELAPLMLPNNSNAFIGMPGHNFGLSNKVALRLHYELGAERRLDHDLSRGFAESDYKGIKSSPMIGVICAQEDRPDLWVKAGRVWQRMALIAEYYGVNMAISAALVEVDLLNMGLKLRLGTRKRPTVVFRAGYATEPRPHSPRMPVGNVVVYEQK